MYITEKRTQLIISYLADNNYLEYCSAYGEPGYNDPDQDVLFCNWNDVTDRIQDYLQEAGYSLEWSDEWIIDYDNGKAYRTVGNSYGWQSSILMCDGYFLTPDDSVIDWIDQVKNECKALPDWITPADIIAEGYELIASELENGLHVGMNDTPEDQLKKAHALGYADVVFRLSDVSQFYVTFECYGV